MRSSHLRVVAAFMVLLTACSSAGEAPPDAAGATAGDGTETVEDRGGAITIGLGALPDSLDPYVNATPPRSYLLAALFTTLTRVEGGAPPETVPALARSWERVDELTWEFVLEPEVATDSGGPLDADAVAASASFVLDEANGRSLRSQLGTVSAVDAVDATTVRFTTEQPEPLLPTFLSALAIVPADALAGADAFFAAPQGTGPFAVEAWTPGERLELVANPAAFGEPPALERLTLVAIPEDAARVSALRAGDVQVINKVPLDQLGNLEQDGVAITSVVEPATYLVDLYADEGPLADPRVRQALNLAVDRQGLLDGVLGGQGAVAEGQLVPPSVAGYCEDVEAYPYDPEEARALLAEAGAGELALTMQTSSGFIVNDTLLAQAIVAQLAEVGVDVELEVMETGRFFEAFADPELRADLYAWRLTASPQLDAIIPAGFFRSEGSVHDTGWDSAEYDDAFAVAAAAEPGSEERQEALCTMATVLHDEAPVLFGLNIPDVWASAQGVTGFAVGEDTNPDLIGLSAGG